MRNFTRRCHAPQAQRFDWMVIIGDKCEVRIVHLAVPDEHLIRQLLRLPYEIPILIGRP